MKIKICGLQSTEDIKYINEAMPDYAGFIFAPKSKRKITFDKAISLKQILNKNIKSVGVFVDDTIENIEKTVKEGIIDIIQLHGNEDNNYIKELKKRINIPIIKAFQAEKDLSENIEETKADYILIDNGAGGTGKTFEWGLIPKTDKKIFLAGGLNIDNVEDAMIKVNPYCLDINSGVETNGKKDREKILKITELIRNKGN